MELSEATKMAKAKYHKKWQQENKDKVRAAQERYWNKKAKEIMEGQKHDS